MIVGVTVLVGVTVGVTVLVGVTVGVTVLVGVTVGVTVLVGVVVGVTVLVGVGVTVLVGVVVGVVVGVTVLVGVTVGVIVGVTVGVGVFVGVGVGVGGGVKSKSPCNNHSSLFNFTSVAMEFTFFKNVKEFTLNKLTPKEADKSTKPLPFLITVKCDPIGTFKTESVGIITRVKVVVSNVNRESTSDCCKI